MQLGKIEIKIKKKLILLFNFIIHLIIYNSFVSYRLRDFWYEKQKKKICERKRAFNLDLEGFQAFVHLGCRVGRIYLACDVRSFCVMITLRYGEPELECSRFCYHAH